MSVQLKQMLDLEPLLKALLRKSQEGKIDWRVTAEEDAFLTAVRGELTFEVHRRGGVCGLIGKDQHGRLIYQVEEPVLVPPIQHSPEDEEVEWWTGLRPETTLSMLHKTARRIALRLDERLESSLRLIESL